MIPGANVVEPKRRGHRTNPAEGSSSTGQQGGGRPATSGTSASATTSVVPHVQIDVLLSALHPVAPRGPVEPLHIVCRRLMLSKFGQSPSSQPVRLRGLVNSSNHCFLNAVMQALVSLPPLVQLAVSLENGTAPTWNALGRWFETVYTKGGTPSQQVALGCVAAPKLQCLQPSTGGASRTPLALFDGRLQQDAHEFTTHLLQLLRDEVCQVEGAALSARTECVAPATAARPSPSANDAGKRGAAEPNGGKGWITVGKGKEKLSVTTTGDDASAKGQSDRMWRMLFGGELHSYLRGGRSTARGVTSVTREPFLCIPLNVEIGTSAPPTVAELIEAAFGVKETIDDASRDREMSRTQQIGALPTILVVQLKRWAVTAEGDVVKLDNTVRIGHDLLIPSSALGQAAVGVDAKQRSYRLQSVIAHRGTGPEGRAGHYVTYVVPGAAAPSGISGPSAVVPNGSPGPHAPVTRAGSTPIEGTGGGGGGGGALTLLNDTKVTSSTMAAMERDTPYMLFYLRR